MRYSLEPTYRRYVNGYGFLSFARKFGDKYGKKLTNTATKLGTSKYGKKIIDTTKKQGSEFAKTAGKRTVQKSAEATRDLIGNKIADKLTLLGKSKNKEKKTSEVETSIPPEKRQQIIKDLRCFSIHIQLEYQKIANL